MSVALLDVNVLIALFDEAHIHYEHAHRWFGQNRKYGWAACPITINGCIRIMSSPLYRHLRTTPDEVAHRLRGFCDTPEHQFWPDSVSMVDGISFEMSNVIGHKNVTDVYLLGLAIRNHGRLATFDHGIPLNAVSGARPGNLVVIRSV